jgi:predicted kinase
MARTNKQKIIICRGLPASGKTSFAKTLEEKGWVRIEKDEIRQNTKLFKDGAYNHKRGDEGIVLKERNRLIRQALERGQNVISSDTNLHPQHVTSISAIAREYGAKVETKDFLDVPLAELIMRDSLRENGVGEQVIREMFHKNHLTLPTFHKWKDGLPFVVWVDIDGTLTAKSSLKKRSAYDFSRVGGDDPNLFTTALVDGLSVIGYAKIFIFSGREDSCRTETEEWLERHDVEYEKLVMRKTGDSRPDDEVKYEMFQEHIEGKYNCLGVLDDRDRVSTMARDVLGLNVAQFGDIKYIF